MTNEGEAYVVAIIDLVLSTVALHGCVAHLLGEGKTLEEIMESRKGKAVTEGVHTAAALMTMARKHAVEMPIAEIIHRCVGQGEPEQILHRGRRKFKAAREAVDEGYEEAG